MLDVVGKLLGRMLQNRLQLIAEKVPLNLSVVSTKVGDVWI